MATPNTHFGPDAIGALLKDCRHLFFIGIGGVSLNLSNSVAIIAYEAMRQQNFDSLQTQGELTGRSEND